MRKLLLLILIILIIYFSGCATPSITPLVECSKNDECAIGGCSGQLCDKKDVINKVATTCEWKEEYGCFRLTQCLCIQNKCQWNQTPEYQQCIANFTH